MTVLPETTTPSALAECLGWSERRVRDLARRLGACRILGNRMVLLEQDVEAIRAAVLNGKSRLSTRGESAVYFIAVRGFIKIGWSENWRLRLSNIQTSNPDRVEVLLVIGRPKIFEKTMHGIFAEHRANGEWFRDCPEIRNYIVARKHECWTINQ